MTESHAITTFVAFCIEQYKHRKGISGAEAAALFCQFGVDKFLEEEYEVEHTLGHETIVDDIERFIAVRRA